MSPSPSLLRLAIVASRFNELITKLLVDGACTTWQRHGVAMENIDVYFVPGALELPLLASKLVATKRYSAIVAIGAVIRGATDHYEYVCRGACEGLARVSLDSGIPIMNAVLTTDTLEQALERSGGKGGNKGAEAALGALEMAGMLQAIANESSARHQ